MAEHINVDLTAHPGLLGPGRPGLLVDPRPGATGRWQPTRAGAVNSWLWTEEQFLFRNGWLALVGRNGSGKSLTAAMLFPTLIDGDVSQKALSVAGHAIGSLGDRHTNRKPGPPKTGLWWQEYGRTDHPRETGEQETRWLTTGLWLRNHSSSKTTERAWFLAPARIGEGLLTERDRAPVDIEDLASQLAALGGQLFVSSEQLTRAASRHITVLGEDAYPEAVRAALHRPLDLDQLGALTNVLRALRGVRVNDKIPPDHMQATLTSALPALDGERVQRLANALTETEQMQRRLERARQQREALSDIAGDYRRYAGAVAAVVAAQMLHDNADYQRRAREEEELVAKRGRQEGIRDLASQVSSSLRQQLDQVGQTVEVLQDRARGHKGAALDQLRRHAEQLESAAGQADTDANEAEAAVTRARQSGDAQDEKAAAAAVSVQGVLSRVQQDTAELNASAYSERMAELSAHLADTTPGTAGREFEELTDEALAPLRAWMAGRTKTLNAVSEAVAKLEAVKQNRDDASDRLASQQAAADEAAATAEEAAESASLADAALRDQLVAFAAALRRLPQPPELLLHADLLDPGAIERWADLALQQVLAALDVPGAESRAAAIADTAQDARKEADSARNTAENATGRAAAAAGMLADLVERLPGPRVPMNDLAITVRDISETIETGDDAAAAAWLTAHSDRIAAAERESRARLGQRRRALQQASDLLAAFRHAKTRADQDNDAAVAAENDAVDAQRAADAATAEAATSTVTWIRDTLAWAAELRVLDCTALRLPVPTDLDSADPSQLAADLASAHRKAEAVLTKARAEADAETIALTAHQDKLNGEIAAAEISAPQPDAPSWRPDRQGLPGAPLWALVDFTPGMPANRPGLLEGALLASGLLDAWVSPDGQLRNGDVHLVPGKPLSGPTLADMLVAQDGTGVPAEHVRSLLASIRVTDEGTGDDASVVFDVGGTVRSGLIQAASPANWAPRYIGTAARERARLQRLNELRSERAEVETALAGAVERIRTAESDIARAAEEAATVPDPYAMTKRRQEAAEHAAEAKRRAVAAASVREEASASASRANDAWASGAQACSSAHIPADPESVETAIGICGDLPDLIAQAAAAGQSAITAQSAALASALRAAVQAQRQAEAETAAAQARHAAEESAAERKQLPNLEAARQARHQAEETARNAHAAAEAAAAAAAEVERQDTAVRKAFTDLNKAARTPDGRMVPTDSATVSEQREHLTELRDTAEDWSRAASRAHLLLVTAATQREAADEAERGARRGRAQARKLGGEAQTARHRYTEELRQHGRDYQDLVAELEDRQGEYKQISGLLKAEEDKGSSAEKELAAIGARLSGLEEHRQIAANNCDRSLSRLQLLFDHGLIQDVVGAETLTRPAILDEAADTARRLLEGRSLQRDNLVASAQASARQALNRLDTRIRSVRDRLLRLGRHIHLEDVAETGWRRVAVAEQSQESADTPVSATTTKPLRAALETLTLSIQKLESDFNERVRTEVKGTLLSDLRKQINIRIELASQIVADITDTLKKVRTGVARVGVKLAWLPREDPLAAQAISLIRDPRLEEELDGMYDFFIKQLVAEGSEDTSWAERVRQVFDYRNWYQWEIHLTHADFTEPGSGESFRKVTPRNNPLETLSTGEKRLAVMLPLLAAARAFYSVDGYEGPRTIFIDELNAAFDPQNLRMMLALLREWNFDLIATLPTMDPLLVAETGSVAVHRIGKQREEFRYAIPCVWDGNGQPVTVQIAVGSMASKRRHSGRAADPATAAPATGEALFDLTSGTA